MKKSARKRQERRLWTATLEGYGTYLRRALDMYVEGTSLKHEVRIVRSPNRVVCSVEFANEDERPVAEGVRVDGGAEPSRFPDDIWSEAKSGAGWRYYLRRRALLFEESKVHICKPARMGDWAIAEAVKDSDEIISKILLSNRRK